MSMDYSIVFARWTPYILHLIHGSFGPCKSVPQTASSSVQPLLQGSRSCRLILHLPSMHPPCGRQTLLFPATTPTTHIHHVTAALQTNFNADNTDMLTNLWQGQCRTCCQCVVYSSVPVHRCLMVKQPPGSQISLKTYRRVLPKTPPQVCHHCRGHLSVCLRQSSLAVSGCGYNHPAVQCTHIHIWTTHTQVTPSSITLKFKDLFEDLPMTTTHILKDTPVHC